MATVPEGAPKWHNIDKHAKYCFQEKTYKKEYKKLMLNLTPGTPTMQLMEKYLLPTLLKEPECTVLPGQEPRGDLEREIQAWLDSTNS
eukprot:6989231-Lingulodinium_polyedra.AAC.1